MDSFIDFSLAQNIFNMSDDHKISINRKEEDNDQSCKASDHKNRVDKSFPFPRNPYEPRSAHHHRGYITHWNPGTGEGTIDAGPIELTEAGSSRRSRAFSTWRTETFTDRRFNSN